MSSHLPQHGVWDQARNRRGGTGTGPHEAIPIGRQIFAGIGLVRRQPAGRTPSRRAPNPCPSQHVGAEAVVAQAFLQGLALLVALRAVGERQGCRARHHDHGRDHAGGGLEQGVERRAQHVHDRLAVGGVARDRLGTGRARRGAAREQGDQEQAGTGTVGHRSVSLTVTIG